MLLKSIQYTQFEGTNRKWSLEKFELQKLNLIVGKNATGKTRIINVIQNLAKLIAAETKLIFKSGNYNLTFQDKSDIYIYTLKYKNANIINEKLIINEVTKLNRGDDGSGMIYAFLYFNVYMYISDLS